jgi:hypothetical protein
MGREGVRAVRRRTVFLMLALLVAGTALGFGIGALVLDDPGSPDDSDVAASGSKTSAPPDATCATASDSRELLVGTSVQRAPGETYEQAWQRRVSTWGVEPEMARFFYRALPVGSLPQFGNAQVMASFKLPVVDGKADVAGLLHGKYDEQLTSWFASMPRDGTPKYVAFWHEPEDEIANGLMTDAQFQQAFEYVRALAAKFDGTARNIRVGVVLMAFTANPASGRDIADYLPPGVAFVGWDVYPLASEQDTQSRLAQAAEASCDAGVPQWFLAETAINAAEHPTQSETARWIPMVADAARRLGYSGLMYFDSTVGGEFRLTSRATWQAMDEEIRRK